MPFGPPARPRTSGRFRLPVARGAVDDGAGREVADVTVGVGVAEVTDVALGAGVEVADEVAAEEEEEEEEEVVVVVVAVALVILEGAETAVAEVPAGDSAHAAS